MNLTMEQVREMDNTALRVLVAQLLGWTDIYEQFGEWEEERAFDYYGVPLGWTNRTALPEWPEYLDDAVELFNDEQVHAFTLSGLHDFGWSAVICDHKGMKYIEHDRMPARAVVLAWIAWKLNR